MSHKIVILASGNGSTFEAIAKAAQAGNLGGQVIALMTNDDHAQARGRAQALGVPDFVMSVAGADGGDEALLGALKNLNPDLIVLAGYLKKIGPLTLEHFRGRIINTHPSLLPKYGGQGMYGRRVHEAVINSKDSETGISVHIVTKNYDEGPVISQHKVPVSPQDTVDTLEQKVKALEPQFYIETIKNYLEEL